MLSRFLISFAAAFILALPVANAGGVYGTLMVVKGDVKVESRDGKTQKAKIGMKVFPQDTLIAGKDARAKLVMSDKNVLNISPDSKVSLSKYEYDPSSNNKNVELSVLYGKVRATVEQKYDGEKNKFHVKTPSAVAGVRGTDFLTSFDRKTNASKVVTFSGAVMVGQPGPQGQISNAVMVRPGQFTESVAGAPPQAPAAMPAEELTAMKQDTSADSKTNSDSNSDRAPAKEDKKEDSSDDSKSEKSSDQKSDSASSESDGKKSDSAEGDKKDSKKSDSKDSANNEGNKDNKSDSASKDKKSDSSSDKASGDKPSGDKPKADNAGNDKPKTEAKKDNSSSTTSNRLPANSPGSMIDTKDLGPDIGKDINFGSTQPRLPTNFNPVKNPSVQPTPPSTSFINDVISSSKSKTNIIIQVPK